MTRLCLPAWHTRFAPLCTGGGRPKVKSGCGVSSGNVQCEPEKMCASAEIKLRELGYWGSRKLPLTVYTAARYVSSEVGSGTPEEKVAVLEAAKNRARIEKLKDVNSLLLYRQAATHPNYGWYGPVHCCAQRDVRGRCVKLTAPYGRWAATSAEPGIDDILLADFVLAGKTKNFSHADDQLGMEYINDPTATVKRLAAHNDYWVGPLPGVDHWHTFLTMYRPDIAPSSPTGQLLLQRGLQAVASRERPNWEGLPICPRMSVPVFALLALVTGLGVAYASAKYIEPTWRGEWWL